MKTRFLGLILGALLAGGASAQTTSAPPLLNFQGKLARPDGTPVADGNVSIRFSLWDAASGGTEKWSQTHAAVSVRNGTFGVLLNVASPTTLFDGDLWLEIKVGNDAPLTPRQQLVTVAYALKANTVPDNAIGSAKLSSDPTSLNKVSGGLFTINNGNLGIGGAPVTGRKVALTTPPSSYGFAHTDGTRTLSTYVSVSGGWFGTTSNDPLNLFANNSGSPLLKIMPGGNIGIGTTSPQQKLSVAGTIESTTGGFKFPDGTTQTRAFSLPYSATVNLATPAFTLINSHPSTETMIIRNTGGYNALRAYGSVALGGYTTSATGGIGVFGEGGSSGKGIYGHASGTGMAGYFHGQNGAWAGYFDGKVEVLGRTTTNELAITGGSDVAEPFHVREDGEAKPGMVVSIDPEKVGELRLASQAYDRTVAGILSGAGGVKPGMTLTQTGTVADGKHPVALTGRVWCWCDADANGPIVAGDLLTTSATPGHAMRVTEHGKATGATLGKAMSSLKSGKGLVLVLVNLQ
jgi:hypothetical protein